MDDNRERLERAIIDAAKRYYELRLMGAGSNRTLKWLREAVRDLCEFEDEQEANSEKVIAD